VAFPVGKEDAAVEAVVAGHAGEHAVEATGTAVEHGGQRGVLRQDVVDLAVDEGAQGALALGLGPGDLDDGAVRLLDPFCRRAHQGLDAETREVAAARHDEQLRFE
jgi:hypothetical protein